MALNKHLFNETREQITEELEGSRETATLDFIETSAEDVQPKSKWAEVVELFESEGNLEGQSEYLMTLLKEFKEGFTFESLVTSHFD